MTSSAQIIGSQPKESFLQPAFAFWLIALAPIIHFMATWDSDGQLSPSGYAIRHFSIPVLLAEIGVIFVALQNGFDSKHAWQRLSKPVKILFFLTALAAILSAFTGSEKIAGSLFITLRYFIQIATFATILHLVAIAKPFDTANFSRLAIWGGVIYLAAFAVFMLLMKNPVDFPWTTRLPSATNIRQIGIVVALLATFPLATLLYSKQQTYLPAIALFCCALFIAWSGTRSAVLAIIISFAASLFFVKSMPSIKRLLLALFSLISAGSASLLLPNPTPMFGLLRMTDKLKDSAEISSGRIDVWLHAAELIPNRAFIGHGSGNFRESIESTLGYPINHPHNLELQFLYDWGLIGGGAALLLMAILTFKVLKLASREPLTGFIATSCLLTALAISQIDGPFHYPLPTLIVIAAITPLLARYGNNGIAPESTL